MPVGVVATAGHVDHGKSTLVKALTGSDPDRLAEERRRGMTIDLGFAWTTLPSGRELAFVDVPGHVRFVKNMLAGAGAVEACLFVVAADDGWMPQSEEHLRILELLALRRGVVAVSKVAGVDRARRRAVAGELAVRLAGTFLATAPVVEVDAPSGVGLPALVAALDDLVAGAAPAPDLGRPRLFVDRAFSARGAGTVVTGTLTGGSVAVGDELAVVPGPGPGMRPLAARVRGVQSHGRQTERGEPGTRVALNLAGVERRELTRGQALVHLDQWEPAATFDVALRVLPGLGHGVGRRGAYQLHVGSAQHAAAVRLLGAASLAPGELGAARLHLQVPLPLLPGDRYVLRESGRSETVGGGEVLEVAPVTPAARARPDRSLERVVRERGWVDAGLLARLTGELRPPNAGRFVVDEGALSSAAGELGRALAEAGPLGIELAGLSERQRAVAALLDGAIASGGRLLTRAAAAAGPEGLGASGWLAALRASPFVPPEPGDHGVDAATLRELVRRGSVVASGGCWFAADAVASAIEVVESLLAASPGGVPVSAVREALGTTRKYALPLLAHLDAVGVTRRRGDLRVAGGRRAAAGRSAT